MCSSLLLCVLTLVAVPLAAASSTTVAAPAPNQNPTPGTTTVAAPAPNQNPTPGTTTAAAPAPNNPPGSTANPIGGTTKKTEGKIKIVKVSFTAKFKDCADAAQKWGAMKTALEAGLKNLTGAEKVTIKPDTIACRRLAEGRMLATKEKDVVITASIEVEERKASDVIAATENETALTAKINKAAKDAGFADNAMTPSNFKTVVEDKPGTTPSPSPTPADAAVGSQAASALFLALFFRLMW